MTSSFKENVNNYLFSQSVTRYCMIYFGNPSKIGFRFLRVNYIFKNLTLKILNFVFILWTFTVPFRKRKKIGGHQTNYLSGGPNSTPPQQISRIFQYKTLRTECFRHLYITYYLYEVPQHYNAKRRKRKQCIISAKAGINLGPLVPLSHTLTTKLRGQVVRGSN